MVFYLKYRPQTLSELDNIEVANLLERYLSQNRVPHAFLFAGPKGTGKTSTARILAKSVNCLSSKKRGLACGKCDICTSIAKGENLDILEIDAASNRGIDDVRDLREKIKLTPLGLKYKVYIIDEVHMLTTEAFNALLKTLEEPPRHAIFILATTEIHKVPDTIVSRCIRVDFHRASDGEILHSLKRIVRGEKLVTDDKALLEIAKVSDGSFRDAAKILEEISLEHRKITLDKVFKKIGGAEESVKKDFLKNLKLKKTKELLQNIQKLSSEGKNVRQFFLEILHTLEELLLNLYSKNEESQWSKDELVRAISLFARAFTELKTAVIATLPFELAIVEYCEGRSQNLVSETNPAQPKETTSDTGSSSTSPLLAKWPEILEALKGYNHSVVGVLRSCRPLGIESGVFSIEAAYKFHAERLSDSKVKNLIAKAVKDTLGLDLKIEIVLKQRN